MNLWGIQTIIVVTIVKRLFIYRHLVIFTIRGNSLKGVRGD